MIFSHRKQAGEQLAGRLAAFANRTDVIVLALIPGGVPVGFEISRNLNLDFDILPLFKFYSPYNTDSAFGAVSLGDVCYIENSLVRKLDVFESRIVHLKNEAKYELDKLNCLYRNNKPWVNLEDKIVIIADDGTCSEEDIYFSTKIISKHDPKGIIIASPIITSSLYDTFEETIENIIFIAESNEENNIDNCYQEFSNVSDNEVNLLFERSNYNKLMN